jgi:CelD/BcsL family acetyltransferase involved in cellulose biosynthesis
MRVDIIDTMEAFDALQQNWNRVQTSDPEAGYFLSWRWLAVVFRANEGRWRVLAARSDNGSGDYICFLPLRLDIHWSESRTEFTTEIDAGGRLSWAQYTGFVCLPGWEETALTALAGKLREMPWSKFRITSMQVSDRRRDLFLSGFDPDDYETTYKARPRAEGEIDNRLCPFVPLPDSYEDYLASCVSSNTRQKIRRFSRRLAQAGDLEVKFTPQDLFEKHLDLILELWLRKWTPVRGEDTAERVATKYRKILAQSMECDAVIVPTMWAGDALLGGLVHIVDRSKGHVYFIVAGRDQEAADPFIGLILHAQSIRWAIENKFKIYDLCHGNEAYKYSLGAIDKRLDHLVIRRRSRVEIGRLDPIQMPEALEVMAEFLTYDRVDDTISACRQLAALAR